MSKLESYDFEAPAHWASALINGDCTSFSDDEQVEFDAWCEANPELARDVVDCSEETFDRRFNGLIHEMLTYSALRHT